MESMRSGDTDVIGSGQTTEDTGDADVIESGNTTDYTNNTDRKRTR